MALRAKGRSIYDIRIEFENAAPIDLVKRAIKEKKGTNRVWIVFDMKKRQRYFVMHWSINLSEYISIYSVMI